MKTNWITPFGGGSGVALTCLTLLGLMATTHGATFVVSNAADAGADSLRDAILQANANPGPDTIEFNIPPSDSLMIQPNSALPDVTGPTWINGRSQPGFSALGVPIIEINGLRAGLAIGLTLRGGNSRVEGLAITSFELDGMCIVAGNSNVITGNYIGVNTAGDGGVGNQREGLVIYTSHNTIGGFGSLDGNLVSQNHGHGIWIIGNEAHSNRVHGNRVGTTPDGRGPLGNGTSGIVVEAHDNIIGSPEPGGGNVVSDNASFGVELVDFGNFLVPTSGNVVQGNLIGTDVTGLQDLGNLAAGLVLRGASSNLIGGSLAGTADTLRIGNVISGNQQEGILISALSPDAMANIIQGNLIGVDITGLAPLGNNSHGINLAGAVYDTLVGGFNALQEGNHIAFNGGHGVRVDGGYQNGILGNSIHDNLKLGISLKGATPTPNDPLDVDLGANQLQNWPRIITKEVSQGKTLIKAHLNSTPNTTFHIEAFVSDACDPSHHGEGQTWVASDEVMTDPGGTVSFAILLPYLVPSTNAITLTATDSSRNTSEFSRCHGATPVLSVTLVNQNLVLTWPLVYKGYWIQRTERLGDSINGDVIPSVWEDMDLVPEEGKDGYEVRLPLEGRAGYYRLMKEEERVSE